MGWDVSIPLSEKKKKDKVRDLPQKHTKINLKEHKKYKIQENIFYGIGIWNIFLETQKLEAIK